MNTLPNRFSSAVLGLALALGAGLLLARSAAPVRGDQPSEGPAPQAVEDDMHEFMEYAFEPGYKRLKAQLAGEPEDNNAWKAIKSDALLLAEGGNLLLFRSPDEAASAWQELAVAVRKQGGSLYQAARKKDYQAARASYTAMLQQCNRCHQEFADGEHQLLP